MVIVQPVRCGAASPLTRQIQYNKCILILKLGYLLFYYDVGKHSTADFLHLSTGFLFQKTLIDQSKGGAIYAVFAFKDDDFSLDVLGGSDLVLFFNFLGRDKLIRVAIYV